MKAEFHSLRGFARRLGVPLHELRSIAADTERFYNEFRKKRPGKTDRIIDNPAPRLQAIQRKFRTEFLEGLPLDDSVHGCVRGRSPRTHAEIHCGQRNLASIDIKNCFPSVTNTMVFRLLRSAGLGPKVASLATVLVTRKYHLPQGAASSDRLANLALAQVDAEVREIASRLGLKRGRFVDDFALSGDQARAAIGLVIVSLRQAGFAVGHRKTRNAGATRAHVTTGFTATAHGLKVSAEKKQQIRTRVFELISTHRRGENIDALLNRVQGSLAYLRPTNPGAARRLEKQIAEAGISLLARRA